MAETSIEWSEVVWNPVTGCDRISPGCDNCYALRMAGRLKRMGQPKYQVDGDPRTSGPGFGVVTHPDALDQPYRWAKPRLVFVNSMSDAFHARVPVDFLVEMFAVMATTGHTYQVLTKRPRRAADILNRPEFVQAVATAATARGLTSRLHWPLMNVWIGTSVENQEQAFQRVPALSHVPAGVLFLSCEPLLGGLRLDLDSVDGVIVGGESGPNARPMHPKWVRDIRDQCARWAGFFFKQWGAFTTAPAGQGQVLLDTAGQDWSKTPDLAGPDAVWLRRVGKHAAGRELDGRTWDQMPIEAEEFGDLDGLTGLVEAHLGADTGVEVAR